MDRYSMLYGTTRTGSYAQLGISDGLGDFLSRLGATDPSATAARTQEILRGFEKLPGYEAEPKDTKPVAVRYAPMHLYKLEGMPKSMKPFCALAVSGAENRPGGRNSTYVQTVFFSRESMHESGERNYIDLLFGGFAAAGGRWLSDRDMEDIRERRVDFDCDALPARAAVPDMPDQAAAIRTVEGIYEGRNVILILEEGCGFNRRAVELLTQIYSLMQPRLAAETGFAAYQDPAGIVRLAAETSIRIFLVPYGSDTTRFEKAGDLVINLNDAPSLLEATPTARALAAWSEVNWEWRQPAMESVFADTETALHDKELFVQRSREFFDAAGQLEEWAADSPARGRASGAVDSSARGRAAGAADSSTGSGTAAAVLLEGLKTERESHPEWDMIPWAEENFRDRIPALLGGRRLEELNAETLCQCYFTEDKDEQQRVFEIYEFGRKYGELDEQRLCRLIGDTQKAVMEQEQAAYYGELVQNRDSEYEAGLAQKDAQVQEIIKSMQESQAAYADMARRMENADIDLSHMKDELRIAEEKLRLSEQKRDEAEKALQEAKDRLEQEEGKHKAAKSTLELLRKENVTVRQENRDLKKKSEDARPSRGPLPSWAFYVLLGVAAVMAGVIIWMAVLLSETGSAKEPAAFAQQSCEEEAEAARPSSALNSSLFQNISSARESSRLTLSFSFHSDSYPRL